MFCIYYIHIFETNVCFGKIGLFLGGSIYAAEFVLHEASFKRFGFKVMAHTTGLIGKSLNK